VFSQKPCRASSNIEVALLKLERFHTLYTIKKYKLIYVDKYSFTDGDMGKELIRDITEFLR